MWLVSRPATQPLLAPQSLAAARPRLFAELYLAKRWQQEMGIYRRFLISATAARASTVTPRPTVGSNPPQPLDIVHHLAGIE